MDVENALLLKALVTALPVHRIRGGFYLVSNDLATLPEAEFAQLKLRADLALTSDARRRCRRARPTRQRLAILKAILAQLQTGSQTDYRDRESQQHISKFLLFPANIQSLERLEALGARIKL